MKFKKSFSFGRWLNSVFDLFLFSLHLTNNQNLPDLPGLFSATAPRGASRIRSEDLLIMLLSLSDSDSFPAAEQEDLFESLTKTYFKSTGTVTSGMRTVAEQLNAFLLERNLRSAREGVQAIGMFNLAVFHHDSLYLVHVGPTHSYVMTRDHVQEFTDLYTAGKGAGVSRTINLRYFQEQVQPGDVLLMSANPPAGWTPAALVNSTQLTLDHLRRRLLSHSGPNLEAAVVQLQKGKGQIHRLRLRTSLPVTQSSEPAGTSLVETEDIVDTPAVKAAPPAPAAIPSPSRERPSRPIPVHPPAQPPVQPAAQPPVSPVPVEAVKPVQEALTGVFINGEPEAQPEPHQVDRRAARRPKPASPPTAPAAPSAPPRPKKVGPSLRQRLAVVWLAGRQARQKSSQNSQTLLSRLMPGTTAELPSISPAALLFIAILVPLLVTAIAGTVYFRKGQAVEQQLYIQQAQQFASQAAKNKDPSLQRNDWNQALQFVTKAEAYGRTPASLALHKRAQQALDNMDGVIRLGMIPAIPGGFASSINITRMVATDTDVYLLDSTQGRVLRLFMTGDGYQVDPQFKCGQGPAGGGIIVGPLIDITAIPPDAPNKATLLAIDANGNILYCTPGDIPLSKMLPQPQGYWGTISGITFSGRSLYVLDTKLSAVWIFKGDSSLGFGDAPSLFFGNDVPSISDAVDLIIYSDDLYLLHSDGKMTRCTYSNFGTSPTKCITPFPYMDERPGSDPRPIKFPNTKFTQMIIAQPYSIYLMDIRKPALYHFSLSLGMQQALVPDPDGDYPLPNTLPTAFAVMPDLSATRRAFVAYGNQVFYAPLP
jgi:hypothetical protein